MIMESRGLNCLQSLIRTLLETRIEVFLINLKSVEEIILIHEVFNNEN